MIRQDASTGQLVDDRKSPAPATKGDDGRLLMQVKVYSPFKVYFDEPAYSISAVNDTGPFDILPHHHNFMTLLNPCDLIIQTPYNSKKITITRGVMHVKIDRVTVFLDI